MTYGESQDGTEIPGTVSVLAIKARSIQPTPLYTELGRAGQLLSSEGGTHPDAHPLVYSLARRVSGFAYQRREARGGNLTAGLLPLF
jgi:hypothetical protein